MGVGAGLEGWAGAFYMRKDDEGTVFERLKSFN
jgi:hypothetical protein